MFSINDKNDWKIVRKAFSIIDFTEKDLEVRKLKGNEHSKVNLM